MQQLHVPAELPAQPAAHRQPETLPVTKDGERAGIQVEQQPDRVTCTESAVSLPPTRPPCLSATRQGGTRGELTHLPSL